MPPGRVPSRGEDSVSTFSVDVWGVMLGADSDNQSQTFDQPSVTTVAGKGVID